jgi:ATP-dependent Clp protease ATP-binding subunit ClpC
MEIKMQPQLCSKCKKNIAVVFISRMENGKTINEGLCLRCAKELGLRPVDDMMRKMGINEEDLDRIGMDMMEALGDEEGLQALSEESDEDEDGRTATFPFLNRLMGAMGGEERQQPDDQRSQREKSRENGKASKKTKFLDSYCINLSERARTGKIDRIVGREAETERVIQILNRRQKNNPCLIGEPGVGKTAIAEGLAIRIAEGRVPYKLREKEVYLLDLTALVAGTQFRGQFESRMKGLIEEIRKAGNVILFIDEVHSIVGAGDAEGSMNAANILKPALSRGEIQVVGATTFTEYRKHIEKDSALERRFQPVTITEPSIGEAIEIIKGIAHYYEEFHGIRIPDEVARQAVLLSERYITDRFLPDKAIDLVDEAASDLNLKSEDIARMAQLQKELADIEKERELLTNEGDHNYERLALLRSRELKLRVELDQLEKKGKPELTVENLARVIEQWTKIPASSIQEAEFKRLSELDKRIKMRLLGQDEAVDAVVAAIKRNRVGISSKRKPVSFIFVGSTGVGKTELVKLIASDLFNTPESLVRLDMSEFMEKHTVSRLIGSPPGYVGYDDAGQLTEKIRRKPYSVVLFDEIEKAHPDVLNILLQILDDGYVTDAQGRKVDFSNTILIMTTNAGSDKSYGAVGFGRSMNDQGKEKTLKALGDFLRPEFINRVDEIVYFNRLTEENFRGIASIMLGELRDNLKEKGIGLIWEDSVLDYLTKKSYSITYGARNLRRQIQKDIEDPLAGKIIDNFDQPFTQVKLASDGEQIQIHTM